MEEQDFMHFMDISPVPTLITVQETGEIVRANTAFVSQYEYGTYENLLGKLPDSFWYCPTDRKDFVALLERDGEVIGYSATWKHLLTGQRIDVLLSARVFDLAGRQCIISAVFDLTEKNLLLKRQRDLVEILERSADWYLTVKVTPNDIQTVYTNAAMRHNCENQCPFKPFNVGMSFADCPAFQPLMETIRTVARTRERVDIREYVFMCPHKAASGTGVDTVAKVLDLQIYPNNGHIIVCGRDLEPAVYALRRNIALLNENLKHLVQRLGSPQE